MNASCSVPPGTLFRKSSYSQSEAACVEVADWTSGSAWHTATYSADQTACVEVSEGLITGLRDSKHRDLGALFFGAVEWQAFLDAAK
ncbi:DUF397 domain-containing protein [Nocardiopsis sp. NPDC049922]|uniref:DUF397 domain-containing protein n=1 Tax=Nocardiopsis sp. NPDC049922 TaxID=3155157 RepID=UPI0033DED8AC